MRRLLPSLLVLVLGCTPEEVEPPPDDSLAGASATGFEQRALSPGASVVRGRFEGGASGAPEVVATAFLERWQAELGVDPSRLGEPAARELDEGTTLVRYPVAIDGVPVVGTFAQVLVAGDEVGGVQTVLPTQAPPSTTPTVTMAEAMTTAAAVLEGGVAEEPRLVIVDRARLAGGAAHLSWEVAVSAPQSPEGPVVYVDALEDRVIATTPRARAARDRRVFHCGNETELSLAQQVYEEAGLIEGMTDDPDAEEAFLNALLGHDYWEATFGYDAGVVEAYVHWGPTTLDNAFARSDGRLLFSDGNSDEDTFAHELAHRVINERTGNRRAGTLPELSTEGEPGAVHEALADVFAMLALRRERWQFGNNGGASGTVARDLESPSTPRTYAMRQAVESLGECFAECDIATCDEPDGACDPTCIASTCSGGECWELQSCANDAGYVHDNSTILSHALFNATRGGVTTSAGSRPGIGEAKMERILYRALDHIGGMMGLRESAEAIYDACFGFGFWANVLDLETHGIGIEDCAVLRNALADAGLSTSDTDFDGWPDSHDNCPNDANLEQTDLDRDGAGDLCDLEDGRFLVDLVLWNRTHWDTEMVDVHLLLGDETPSSSTWLEPMGFRLVTRAVAAGELVHFVAADASGTTIAETHCEVRDFHQEYRAPGRLEELRVFFTTDGRNALFCDFDWIAPRSP